MKTFIYSTIIAVSLLSAVTCAQAEDSLNESIIAITRPSSDITLSFVRGGQIAEVFVKEGSTVKPGQLLIKLDDTAEQFQLAQLAAQKDTTIPIDAAQAQLDQKKLELKKLEWAAERGAATSLEVEQAKLAVLISELSLKAAVFEHEQDQKKYNEFKAYTDRMSLKSPIAGKVEKVFVETGESAETRTEVMQVVQINPLWIDIPVALSRAKDLKLDQTAEVKFSNFDNSTATGKITFIAAVADAASTTLTIRVEIPNDLLRPAGRRASVTFLND